MESTHHEIMRDVPTTSPLPDPEQIALEHQRLNQLAHEELEKVEHRARVLRNIIAVTGATIEAYERTQTEGVPPTMADKPYDKSYMG